MSDNVATATKIYEAFGRGDIPAILDHLADDVQWESWADNSAQGAGVPWMAPRRGKVGAAEFFSLVGGFKIHEFQVLSIMSGGNQVAVEFVLDATVPTGNHYRDEELHLWTFNELGKVTRLRHYTDTAKHIAAAAPARAARV